MKSVHMAIGTAFVLAGAALIIPALAHEGHGKVETQGIDLDAPRTISPETAVLIGLKTAEVDFGSIEAVVQITGTVQPLPDSVQAVAPRIAGAIEKVHVQVGDAVRVGDPLVELASPEYLKLLAQLVQSEGRVLQVELALDARRERAEVAKEEYTRVSSNAEAVSANLLSEKRNSDIVARAEAGQAELELRQAQAERDSLKRLVAATGQGETGAAGMLVLRALSDGVVTERTAVTGAGVQAGETLLRVADYRTVQVEAEVPESLLASLSNSVGSRVRLQTSSEVAPVAEGVVRFVSPVIDLVKRTAHLIIEADNFDGALRDGMFVEASVVLRAEQSAVVVPASAVFKDGPVAFVFIKDGEFYKKQDIATGAWDDRVIEVVRGLAPGDVVIVAGGYSVSQMRPKVVAKEPEADVSDQTPPAADGTGPNQRKGG